MMVGLHRPSLTSNQAIRGRPPDAAGRMLGNARAYLDCESQNLEQALSEVLRGWRQLR